MASLNRDITQISAPKIDKTNASAKRMVTDLLTPNIKTVTLNKNAFNAVFSPLMENQDVKQAVKEMFSTFGDNIDVRPYGFANILGISQESLKTYLEKCKDNNKWR